MEAILATATMMFGTHSRLKEYYRRFQPGDPKFRVENVGILNNALNPNYHISALINPAGAFHIILPVRIQYFFEFCAAYEGFTFIESRIKANIALLQVLHVAAQTRVAISVKQVEFLRTLPQSKDESAPCNIDHGIKKFSHQISKDQYWTNILAIEIKVSETGLRRVQLARTCSGLVQLKNIGHLSQAGFNELARRYDIFQKLRDEVVDGMEDVMGWSGGMECLERHRNELWDVML